MLFVYFLYFVLVLYIFFLLSLYFFISTDDIKVLENKSLTSKIYLDTYFTLKMSGLHFK